MILSVGADRRGTEAFLIATGLAQHPGRFPSSTDGRIPMVAVRWTLYLLCIR